VGLGASIVVFAIGAVLRFGVGASASGFDVHTVGLALMIIGAAGLLVSMVLWGASRPDGAWAVFPAARTRRATRRSGPSTPGGPVENESENEPENEVV
jgi:hypothetical protein